MQKKLHEMAARFTTDTELQKDLVQEMWLHLFQVCRSSPGNTPHWYLKSCEFHARNYLRLGRSIDSYKRANGNVPVDPDGDGELVRESNRNGFDLFGIQSGQNGSESLDIFDSIRPRLSERQRTIMTMLLQGCGVREVARQLGITHPAVIKHRKKIAKIAREYLDDSITAASANGAP